MNWWLLIWAIGVAGVLAGAKFLNGRPYEAATWREVLSVILLALLWPLAALGILFAGALDFAKFLIDVARKPH